MDKCHLVCLGVLDDKRTLDRLDPSITRDEDRGLCQECSCRVNGVRGTQRWEVSSKARRCQEHLAGYRFGLDELRQESVVALNVILALEADRVNENLGEGEFTRDEDRPECHVSRKH